MNQELFEEKKKEFLTYTLVERNLSEHTQRAYYNDLSQFGTFWLQINNRHAEPVPLREAVEGYFVDLFHKKITKSSVARKVSCFRSFERFLARQNIDLALRLTRPRIDKRLPIYLTIDEVAHLLDEINDSELPTKRPLRDKTIFELLYATGIRCSELINIKIEHIDFKNKSIRVMGKGRRERLALFGEKAKEKMHAYLMYERPPMRSLDEYLLLNHHDEKLTSRSIQRILEMFRQFLNIERKITPHKLRHSFATHLLNQGADLRAVQELLGHKTLSSTEKYVHVTTQQLSNLCDTLHPLNSTLKTRDESE